MPYTVPIARSRQRVSSLSKLSRATSAEQEFVSDQTLLDEAVAIAWRLGRHIIHRDGCPADSGVVWVRGRKHLVLSGSLRVREKLAWVAQLLEGDSRLAWIDMSADLAAYLNPRRAA